MGMGPMPAAVPGMIERLLEKVNWWTGFWKRFLWFRPGYEGGVTARAFFGDTSGGSGPQQGQMTYSNLYRTAIDVGQSSDYLADVTIWSRGSVATNGAVTPNTTSILLDLGAGSQNVILAPGDVVTFANKAPNRIYIKAGATPAATDCVMVFW
jgi:hypothetical protein